MATDIKYNVIDESDTPPKCQRFYVSLTGEIIQCQKRSSIRIATNNGYAYFCSRNCRNGFV